MLARIPRRGRTATSPVLLFIAAALTHSLGCAAAPATEPPDAGPARGAPEAPAANADDNSTCPAKMSATWKMERPQRVEQPRLSGTVRGLLVQPIHSPGLVLFTPGQGRAFTSHVGKNPPYQLYVDAHMYHPSLKPQPGHPVALSPGRKTEPLVRGEGSAARLGLTEPLHLVELELAPHSGHSSFVVISSLRLLEGTSELPWSVRGQLAHLNKRFDRAVQQRRPALEEKLALARRISAATATGRDAEVEELPPRVSFEPLWRRSTGQLEVIFAHRIAARLWLTDPLARGGTRYSASLAVRYVIGKDGALVSEESFGPFVHEPVVPEYHPAWTPELPQPTVEEAALYASCELPPPRTVEDGMPGLKRRGCFESERWVPPSWPRKNRSSQGRTGSVISELSDYYELDELRRVNTGIPAHFEYFQGTRNGMRLYWVYGHLYDPVTFESCYGGRLRMRCLAIATRIATPDGDRTLAELAVGDLVWSRTEGGERIAVPLLRIERRPAPSAHQLLSVTLSDGRRVRASASHPGLSARPLGELSLGERYDGAHVVGLHRQANLDGATWDLLPDGPTGIYWAGGVPLISTLRTQRPQASSRPQPLSLPQ